MRRVFALLTVIGVVVCLAAADARAAEYTIAVLQFESRDKAPVALGAQVTDLLTAELSKDPTLRLVERAALNDILREMQLSAAGLVENGKAITVGKLAGAQILVAGKAFPVGKDLALAAKVIGTETSVVYAVVVKLPMDSELQKFVAELAQKVSNIIEEKGAEIIVGQIPVAETLTAVRAKLKGMELPTVGVTVTERHVGAPARDPAAEIEFIYSLKRCGFTVVSDRTGELSTWALKYLKDTATPPPKDKVDVVILGDATSELGSRLGGLVSCKARVEIQAVDLASQRVLSVGRETTSGIDVSEQIAAKAAVQKAAAKLARGMIPELVKEWNDLKTGD